MAARSRYVTLDAMRGVAAIFVVWRHCGVNLGGYVPRFSYLAVDLFFVLSGFVLAYANDRAFSAGQTKVYFLKARALRIFPLYLAGLVIGVVGQMVAPEVAGVHRWISVGINAVALPSPFATHAGNPFPTNHVFWSIFFELWVANLLYCAFWKQLHGRSLLCLIGISAVGLLLSEKLFYTIDVGMLWGNFAAGFARVCFSFFAGVALSRLHARRPPRLKVPSLLPILILVFAFVIPLEGRLAHIFEVLAVTLLFPALIYWGAEAQEKRPAVGSWLGDMSYALYAIHHPLLRILLVVGGAMVPLASLPIQGAIIAGLLVLASLLAVVDTAFRRKVRGVLLGTKSAPRVGDTMRA